MKITRIGWFALVMMFLDTGLFVLAIAARDPLPVIASSVALLSFGTLFVLKGGS